MKTHTKLLAVGVAAAAAGAALLPAAGSAAPTPLTPPALAGVASLPGPIAPASTPAASMGTLTSTPDTAPAGTRFTLGGGGLPAGKPVTIVWSTANVTWIVDPRPDSVDYLG